MDIPTLIFEYESGQLSDERSLELFAELIENGMAWTLQGSYGRMATKLIANGYISRQGKILKRFR